MLFKKKKISVNYVILRIREMKFMKKFLRKVMILLFCGFSIKSSFSLDLLDDQDLQTLQVEYSFNNNDYNNERLHKKEEIKRLACSAKDYLILRKSKGDSCKSLEEDLMIILTTFLDLTIAVKSYEEVLELCNEKPNKLLIETIKNVFFFDFSGRKILDVLTSSIPNFYIKLTDDGFFQGAGRKSLFCPSDEEAERKALIFFYDQVKEAYCKIISLNF